MKLKDLNDIISTLVKNGFGENEIDSMDTSEDYRLCLCISGVFKNDFIKIFGDNPLEKSNAYISGFHISDDIYINEKKQLKG